MDDHYFEAIGSFGAWQKTVYGIVFYSWVVGMWQNFAMTFLAPNVPFRCTGPEVNFTDGDGQLSDQCSVSSSNVSEQLACTEWEYDTSKYSDNLVSEWNLVCDRAWLISFAKSVYMIGYMTSVFILGQMSDRYGRRPIMIACYGIQLAALILSPFSTSVEVFLVFRFLQAFGRSGVTTIGYVLMMEIVGPRHRSCVASTIQLGKSFSLCTLVAVGYFFRHWFWFEVAMAVAVMPLAFFVRSIPESPRWLAVNRKSTAFKEVLTEAAKKNRVVWTENVDEVVQKLTQVTTNTRKSSIIDLFRMPQIRYRTMINMYLWVVTIFVYYSVSFNTNDLYGDPYINFLISGVLEIPAYGQLYIVLKYVGRKPLLLSYLVLTGTLSTATLAVPADLPWLVTALFLLAKFCMTSAFGVLYMYTGELFPTVVRTTALGSCSTVGRIGSIAAPFSRDLGKITHSVVPNILYSVLAISSGFLTLCLPETAGHKLPDTIKEEENVLEVDAGPFKKSEDSNLELALERK